MMSDHGLYVQQSKDMGSQSTPANEEHYEQPSDSMLDILPLELLDIILENSLLHWILNYSPHKRNEDAINSLASVNFCCFQRVTRRRFKNRIWHRLKYLFGKTRKLYAITRNNGNYLLENIQSNDELLRLLLSFNCITKEQSDIIQRQRSSRNKNDKLLHFLRCFDQTKSSSFVRCLRRTNQKTVASVIENGGVMIKVHVRCRCAMDALLDTQLGIIHQKIEDLRNRTIPRSHQIAERISELKNEGIEILNSHRDRQTVVVWIWCHSQTAHENIQTLYESNQLANVLFDLLNFRPCAPESFIQSIVISIDKNHFKKTSVVLSISVNFTGKLDVETDESMQGLTKLRDEIYILCQLFSNLVEKNTIRVFEDRFPFRFQRAIEIKDIESCSDVVSSEKGNCLLVSDTEGKCVWKISREIDHQYRIIKWLTTDYPPFILSVSNCGHLLVLSHLTCILIYGSDAGLIRSIQLPTGVKYPRHVAETSFGNFIVLHKWSDEKKADPTSIELEGEWIVSELSRDGQTVIRRFLPSNGTQKLKFPTFFSLDSDYRVLVADEKNSRVVLLDSDLEWNRVIRPAFDKRVSFIRYPRRLWYDEGKTQLIVTDSKLKNGIDVHTLSRK